MEVGVWKTTELGASSRGSDRPPIDFSSKIFPFYFKQEKLYAEATVVEL